MADGRIIRRDAIIERAVALPATLTTAQQKLAALVLLKDALLAQHNLIMPAAKDVAATRRDFDERICGVMGQIARLREAEFPAVKGSEPAADRRWSDLCVAARKDAALKAALSTNPILAAGISKGVEVDPTEDFSTYTEKDDFGLVTVTTSTVTTTQSNVDVWLVKDAGAGHFTNAFTHTFKTTNNVGASQAFAFWGVGNTVSNWDDWYDNARQGAIVRVYGANTYFIDRTSPTWAYDSMTTSTSPLYWRAIRSGANGQTLTATAYSDEAMTTAIDAIAVALTNDQAYRYVFAALGDSLHSFSGKSVVTANMDLNEVAAGATIPILMSSQRRWRL
jgi:hypothetical protein